MTDGIRKFKYYVNDEMEHLHKKLNFKEILVKRRE